MCNAQAWDVQLSSTTTTQGCEITPGHQTYDHSHCGVLTVRCNEEARDPVTDYDTL